MMEQINPRDAVDDGSQTRWLVTFTDLIALLLAFFVMLFSMAAVEPEPWEKIANSLTAQLNPDFGWDSLSELSDLDADTTPVDDATDLDYLQAVITDKIRNVPLLSQYLLTKHSDRLIISLQADTLFLVGSAELSEDGRAALYAMGNALGYIANRVDVNGHTDPSPVRGGAFASNWELSVHRALAVAEALRSAGYTSSIAAIGFAESHFDEQSAVIDKDMSYRRARRVDVVIRESVSTAGNYGS